MVREQVQLRNLTQNLNQRIPEPHKSHPAEVAFVNGLSRPPKWGLHSVGVYILVGLYSAACYRILSCSRQTTVDSVHWFCILSAATYPHSTSRTP